MGTYEITLLIICPLIFLAGFVDSVAGGGGLISLPAYLLAGVPIHMAYGTNKFANCIGTSVASAKFFKSGNINLKPALVSAIGALMGSWLGAQLVVFLEEKYLNLCMIVVLPLVTLFLLFNRRFGEDKVEEKEITKKGYLLFLLIGFVVGGYDGFVGPGTGTFLIIGFTSFCGLNLIKASGNAKIVNLASNFAALIVYLINGKVAFAIGIPAAICAIAGNYIGSHLAIKNGAKFIKPIILLVIALLFVKMIMAIV